MELKEEYKDIIDIQIIAFPQEGMYSYKGGDELVEEALKMEMCIRDRFFMVIQLLLHIYNHLEIFL